MVQTMSARHLIDVGLSTIGKRSLLKGDSVNKIASPRSQYEVGCSYAKLTRQHSVQHGNQVTPHCSNPALHNLCSLHPGRLCCNYLPPQRTSCKGNCKFTFVPKVNMCRVRQQLTLLNHLSIAWCFTLFRYFGSSTKAILAISPNQPVLAMACATLPVVQSIIQKYLAKCEWTPLRWDCCKQDNPDSKFTQVYLQPCAYRTYHCFLHESK